MKSNRGGGLGLGSLGFRIIVTRYDILYVSVGCFFFFGGVEGGGGEF